MYQQSISISDDNLRGLFLLQELFNLSNKLSEKERSNIANKLSKEFLNNNAKTSTSLIHYAVSTNNIPMVKWLLKKGVKVDIKNSFGYLPIHVVSSYEITKLLVKSNKNIIHVQCNYGSTALHSAIQRKLYQIAIYLLRQGADPNIKNVRGYTAWDMRPNSDTVQQIKKSYNDNLKSCEKIGI